MLCCWSYNGGPYTRYSGKNAGTIFEMANQGAYSRCEWMLDSITNPVDENEENVDAVFGSVEKENV